MNNTRAKPRLDPITGKAHIINWENPAYGYRRCCSYCYSAQARDQAEEKLERCWYCFTEFDHADDDPRDPEEYYD